MQLFRSMITGHDSNADGQSTFVSSESGRTRGTRTEAAVPKIRERAREKLYGRTVITRGGGSCKSAGEYA